MSGPRVARRCACGHLHVRSLGDDGADSGCVLLGRGCECWEWHELATGPYSTIVADPPWPSMHQRSTYHRGKPERHYSTMTVEEIIAIDAGRFAARDAHLWLWGVNRLMEDAYRVVRAWGFTPMSVLTWCKPGPGMGYYFRSNTEHCIFATRGRPMVPESKVPSCWFEWPRRRHSEKPPEFYDVVETISPGRYLEMFARDHRLGWDAWGDEAPFAVEIPA